MEALESDGTNLPQVILEAVWHIERPYVRWYVNWLQTSDPEKLHHRIEAVGVRATALWYATNFWAVLSSIFCIFALPLLMLWVILPHAETEFRDSGLSCLLIGLLLLLTGGSRRLSFNRYKG